MAESDNLLPETSSCHSRVHVQWLICRCPKLRKVQARGAVLVIMWTFLVSSSFFSLVCGNYANLKVVPPSVARVSIIGAVIVVLLGPLTGLAASFYFGRYKTVCASFWLMWSGTIVITVVLVVLRLRPEAQQVWAYTIIMIAEGLYFTGLTAFLSNSLPFGLDQMPDASAEQITAFIHWYTWSFIAGVITSRLPYTINECISPDILRNTALVLSLLSACLITLALCSTFLMRERLIIEPETKSPLKVIFSILKFTAEHRVPIRRSAFAYCETKKPSRLDFAKSKYGGPHTYEDVENVKTILRMLVIAACVSVTSSFSCAVIASEYAALHSMFHYSDSHCNDQVTKLTVCSVLCVLFCLPVYDIFVNPLITRWFSNTLRRVGLALGAFAFVSVFLLVVSIVWYMSTSQTQCMFEHGDISSSFHFDRRFVELPTYLVSFGSVAFLLTATMEFVCAQAPYKLRGLATGLGLATVLVTACFGAAFEWIWVAGYHDHAPDSPTCGVWFYLFTTISTVLGCVVWCIVAKWYKKREREEPEMCRIYAENYYSK